MLTQKKFNKKFTWLHIFDHPSTIDDPNYHYFSHPVPGYQKVSLNRTTRRPLTMYYETEGQDNKNHKSVNQMAKADQSIIRDFQHLDLGTKKAGVDIVIDRSAVVADSQWVKKYEPNKFVQLLTEQKINRDILTWLKSWDSIVFNKNHHHKMENHNAQYSAVFHQRNRNNSKQGQGDSFYANHRRMILLAGPPGCGKTTLIRVVANHCKYQVEEINASEDRSANNLIKRLEDIGGNETIRKNQKPTLICLDEVDGAAENEASGFSKVLEFIETGRKDGKGNHKKNTQNEEKVKKQYKPESKYPYPSKFNNHPNYPQKKQHLAAESLNRPIIFICNDPYAKSLKQLRSKAHVIYFSTLSTERVVKRMKDIMEKEKIYIQLAVLQKICQICKNDIRSCIGILELVARQKKISGRNPKDIINRMKLSFVKDNQSTMNDFMNKIFHPNSSYKNQNNNSIDVNSSLGFLKKIERQVLQIGNPSLLMEYFLQNLVNVKGITRKGAAFLELYKDLVRGDMLLRNGYKYNHQLENYHMIPFANFALHFQIDEAKKLQFPSGFFQRLKKTKQSQQILNKIYDNIPLQIRIFYNRKDIMSSYLLLLYLSMQATSAREDQINRCICRMISYNFSLKKQFKDTKSSIFQPQIDTVLTFGNRKPELLLSIMTKTLMEENYEFFKERKQLLSGTELKDSTEALLNQMQIQSRKKRKQEEGFKFKYLQGTGTKTSYVLNMDYFFK